MECCCILAVPTPSVFAYNLNLVINEHPDTTQVRQVAAIECFMMALVRFLHASEQIVVGFHFHEPPICQSGCTALVTLYVGVGSRIDHYSFVLSSSNEISTPLPPIWYIIALQKSIGRL